MVDFAGNHVVVTGGTGALGRAVVAALRAAHAVCHVPNLVAAELADFPYADDPAYGSRAMSTSPTRLQSPAFTGDCRRFGLRSTSPAVLRWRR